MRIANSATLATFAIVSISALIAKITITATFSKTARQDIVLSATMALRIKLLTTTTRTKKNDER